MNHSGCDSLVDWTWKYASLLCESLCPFGWQLIFDYWHFGGTTKLVQFHSGIDFPTLHQIPFTQPYIYKVVHHFWGTFSGIVPASLGSNWYICKIISKGWKGRKVTSRYHSTAQWWQHYTRMWWTATALSSTIPTLTLWQGNHSRHQPREKSQG